MKFKKIVSGVLTLALGSLVFGEATKEYQKKAINENDKCVPVFFEAIKDKMNFTYGWKEGCDAAEWKKKGLEKAREEMITWEDDTPFEMVELASEQRDGYVAKKVVFNISKESRTLAYLLIPTPKKVKKNQTFPAAIMLHDHGSQFTIGKEKFVKPFASEEGDDAKIKTADMWAAKYFEGTFPGDELAKRGYVVLSIDAFGWGDRSVPGFKTASQQSLGSNLMNMGTSFAAIIAMEDVRAAKFLASLPEVDKTRVVSVGFSMGAFRSWQLAAICDEVTAGISICWFGTMKDMMVIGNGQLKGNSAFAMLHPTIARFLDYPDVAGLAAPKPMLFFNGNADPICPLNGVNKGYDQLHSIWKANGAENKLHTEIRDGGHAFPIAWQNAAFDWIDKQFKK